MSRTSWLYTAHLETHLATIYQRKREKSPENQSIVFSLNGTQAWSRDSVVDIATGHGLDDQEFGVRVPVGSRIFTFPRRPNRLWGPPNLLSN
jgi:hypothetical protein